jgi:hypothetical protein
MFARGAKRSSLLELDICHTGVVMDKGGARAHHYRPFNILASAATMRGQCRSY